MLLAHLIFIAGMEYVDERLYYFEFDKEMNSIDKEKLSSNFYHRFAINQKKETFLMLNRLANLLTSIAKTLEVAVNELNPEILKLKEKFRYVSSTVVFLT